MSASRPRISSLIIRLTLAVAALTALALSAPVSAQSAASVAQGFAVDDSAGTVVAGSLVSLKTGSGQVQLASLDTADQLVGIVGDNPLVVVSTGQKEAQVITSGPASLLVSDINGEIRAGDRIGPSPIAGVGMLTSDSGKVIGTAQAGFKAADGQAQSITDRQGTRHQVHLGRVPVQAGVTYYQVPGGDFLPPFVRSLANTVAGKQVSLLRIMFCLSILLLTFISLSALIYSSSRSAITSLGRNPLASGVIRRGLYEVGIITVVGWVAALAVSYLILKL